MIAVYSQLIALYMLPKETLVEIHAISGIVVFLVGLIQILLKKGGKIHRYLGISYLLFWTVLLITGGLVGHYMITMLGVFGYYYVLTGYRFGKLKRVPAQWWDKLVIGLGIIIALGILTSGVRLLIGGNTNFGIIFVVFGGIFTWSTLHDFRQFILGQPLDKLAGYKQFWFFEHFGRMYISYIAALTAFSALQNVFGMVVLNWLIPVAFSFFLIGGTKRYYIQKFKIEV